MNFKQYILSSLIAINFSSALKAADEYKDTRAPAREEEQDKKMQSPAKMYTDDFEGSSASLLGSTLGMIGDGEELFIVLSELIPWGENARYGFLSFGRIEFDAKEDGADLKFENDKLANKFSEETFKRMQIGENEESQKKVNNERIFLNTKELIRLFDHLQEAVLDNCNSEGRVG